MSKHQKKTISLTNKTNKTQIDWSEFDLKLKPCHGIQLYAMVEVACYFGVPKADLGETYLRGGWKIA